jgi:hypothetical protein
MTRGELAEEGMAFLSIVVALQPVVKVPRRTEAGEAPGSQGATSKNIGNICARSNAARRDATPAECSGTFTTGC